MTTSMKKGFLFVSFLMWLFCLFVHSWRQSLLKLICKEAEPAGMPIGRTSETSTTHTLDRNADVIVFLLITKCSALLERSLCSLLSHTINSYHLKRYDANTSTCILPGTAQNYTKQDYFHRWWFQINGNPFKFPVLIDKMLLIINHTWKYVQNIGGFYSQYLERENWTHRTVRSSAKDTPWVSTAESAKQ